MVVTNKYTIFAAQYSKLKTQDYDTNNAPHMELSIIVPVYQVEKYVRACIESIFRQQLDERRFELIIVNDGTRDRSMEMIADIIEAHPNTTVINQENLSLSVVRNNGIAMARGEYILMPDSDDLLIEGSLSVLLDLALKSKPDLVVANYLVMNDEEIDRTTIIPQPPLTVTEKTGERLLLEDLADDRCYVWRTLYRRQFLLDNGLRFIPGICYQDVPFTHECFPKAGKCLRVNRLLNIYRQGHDSASSTMDVKRAHDFCTAIAETWRLPQKEQFKPEIERKLRRDVFVSFSLLICKVSYSFHKNAVRMEILNYLKQLAPDLRFSQGLKQRITTLFYRHTPHLFMSFHYHGRMLKRRVVRFLRRLL